MISKLYSFYNEIVKSCSFKNLLKEVRMPEEENDYEGWTLEEIEMHELTNWKIFGSSAKFVDPKHKAPEGKYRIIGIGFDGCEFVCRDYNSFEEACKELDGNNDELLLLKIYDDDGRFITESRGKRTS